MSFSEASYLAQVERIFLEDIPRKLGFEVRQGQVIMAQHCAKSYCQDSLLLAEAGTGIGKSLAYLVPSLVWRAQNRELAEPIVVATHTLNLQQQIVDVDVPRLLNELELGELNVVQARGWSNYLCLKRLDSLARSRDSLDFAERTMLEGVWETNAIASQTEELFNESQAEGSQSRFCGTRDDFMVDSALWSQLCCESLTCERSHCRFYHSCYYYSERRLLADADLIVTNHSLVMSDVAVRRQGGNGILPSLARLVFDEAHHLENVALYALGHAFFRTRFLCFCTRLFRERGHNEAQGCLTDMAAALTAADIDEQVRAEVLPLLRETAYGPVAALYEVAEDFFGALRAMFSQDGKLSREDLHSDYYQAAGQQLAEALGEAEANLREVAALLSSQVSEQVAPIKMQVQLICEQLKEYRSELLFCLEGGGPDWILWAERRAEEVGLQTVGLDIGSELVECLFKQVKSAIFCSATLGVAGKLEFFAQQLGLDLLSERLDRCCLTSPFDYYRNCMIAVPRDLPSPVSGEYWQAVGQPLAMLVRKLGGRTLILCTSWSSMLLLNEYLCQELAGSGIDVLCQRRASSSVIAKTFKSEQQCVLLGTNSYWEGFDVPGSALSCVVVMRLPFVVPDDPVHKARCRYLSEKGEDSFGKYSLPLAIIKLRQGFGRLIRTSSDKGLVLIMDSRLVTKRYGSAFRQALPRCREVVTDFASIVEQAADFINS